MANSNALRRLHGLGELAHLGLGGGQGVENVRFLALGELHRPLGKLDGLRAVAYRGVRVGRQQPRGVGQKGDISGPRAKRFAPPGQCLQHFFPPEEGTVEARACPWEVGLDLQGRLVISDGFVKLSPVGEHDTEVVVGHFVVGLRFQSRLVTGDGLVNLSAASQRNAQAGLGFHEVGLEFQGRPVMGDGLVNLSAAGQQKTKVVVGAHVAGLDIQRRLVVGDGLVELSKVGEHGAKVAVGHGVVGFDFQGPAELDDRLVGLSPQGQVDAELVIGPPALGVYVNRSPTKRFAIGVRPALLPGQTGQEGQYRRTRRIACGPMPDPTAQRRDQSGEDGARHDHGRILPVIGHQREFHVRDVYEPQYRQQQRHVAHAQHHHRPAPGLPLPPR